MNDEKSVEFALKPDIISWTKLRFDQVMQCFDFEQRQ